MFISTSIISRSGRGIRRPADAEKAPGAQHKERAEAFGEAYEKDNNQAQAVEVYAAYSQLPGPKDPDACYKAGSLLEKINVARARKIFEDNIIGFSQ